MVTNSPKPQENNKIDFLFMGDPPGFPKGYAKHRLTKGLKSGITCKKGTKCRFCKFYLSLAEKTSESILWL